MFETCEQSLSAKLPNVKVCLQSRPSQDPTSAGPAMGNDLYLRHVAIAIHFIRVHLRANLIIVILGHLNVPYIWTVI